MKHGMITVGLGLLLAASVWAAERPLDLVKRTADKIIGILSNPALEGDAHTQERHRMIRQELEERFDWSTICRGCLGRHWSKLSRDQRSQFMDLFKQFLERTYLDRIEPYYNELDRIDYQGERLAEDNYASVKTVVVTRQHVEHPVEYRLEKTPSGDWRVYDVIIEGVSLVRNYRTQFDDIMNRSGFEGLLNELKAKTAQGPTAR